ncbi:unnamed protein product [Tilletia laevis]|uniref:Uncharacterized protein n=1 Tax=Tilletia laevis TaxID=157183 RepID=A0A9N8M9D8_9BASI|nr:unnamed protein product [Tilletia laevis]
MSLAKKKEWVRSTAHQGLDHGICHVLSSMSILRRRKFTQHIPPESDLPLHQTLAMQLLARLGSIRQGHQQIQGRNNRGERGTAMIKNINKNLTKARTAAYELLPKLNEADKFPWGLPAGAQEIVCDSIKVAPSNMEGDVKDDPRLVQEAVDLLHAGVLTSSDIPTIFFDPSSPSVWIPILPPPTHAAQRRTPEQYPLTPSTSILRQSPPRLPLHVILKDNRHCPHLRRCGLAKLVRRTERGIAYVITLAPDSDLSLETIASNEATTALSMTA